MYLKKFFRLMDPEGDSGGAADRGDDWTPTDDAEGRDKLLGRPAAEPSVDELPPKVGESALKPAKAAAAEGEEGEEGDETETEAETKAKRKENRIPISRANEMVAKERARREAVEVELAKYKGIDKITDLNADLTAAEDSVMKMEKEYAELLTDGKVAEATAIMAKIRRTERSIVEASAQVRETAAEARAVERVRFDTTVERLEAQFPELKVGTETFDAEKVAEVLELKEAYEGKGYTPSAALQKAVKLIMPPETKAQERAVETEARVDPKAVEKERKAAAVAKTVETVAKTPANASKTGLDSDKTGGGKISAKDAMQMPYKDFAALNDETLAAMRGDVL